MTDRDAVAQVAQVATQYFEAWFEGDPARLRAVLHPDLAKRRAVDPDAALTLDEDDADGMVALVAAGPHPPAGPGQHVTVLDLSADMASVKVVSAPFREYLHLARFGDRWLIVNALYELV